MPKAWGRLVSVYFGGGTPGLWAPASLGDVIRRVLSAFRPSGLSSGRSWASAGLEITLEANPGEVTAARAAGWVQAGVNRVSLGVQSLSPRELYQLGRNHQASDVPRAIEVLRSAGISSICCDLMFGLPGQSMADLDASIDGLLGLAPGHISAYGLTIEKGTRFGADVRAGRMVPLADDRAGEMMAHVRARLTAGGLPAYEVSNYARSGHRAVHNQLYWTSAGNLRARSICGVFPAPSRRQRCAFFKP